MRSAKRARPAPAPPPDVLVICERRAGTLYFIAKSAHMSFHERHALYDGHGAAPDDPSARRVAALLGLAPGKPMSETAYARADPAELPTRSFRVVYVRIDD